MSQSYAQSKRAFNLIEKKKYDQAIEMLSKSIEKDVLAAEAKYSMSVLFFTENFPGFNTDSAYVYIKEGISDFGKTDLKEIEKIAKEGIDSLTFVNQKILIENYDFVLTKEKDRKSDYEIYLRKYPTSQKVDSAIWYRNLRAYEKSSEEHTWQAYEGYMQTYPNSEKYLHAKSIYEQLIYIDKTSDGKLPSYRDFLSTFPSTPYREEVEKMIFTISTGDHTIDSYEQFILDFPNSKWNNTAALYITMINEDYGVSEFSSFLNKDSLQRLKALEKQQLFVRYEGQQYVFQATTFQIRSNLTWIDDSYKCGEINERFLLVENDDTTRIINRAGSIIYSYPGITKVEDLGQGIISFRTSDGIGAILVNGKLIAAPLYEDVQIIQGRYLAIKSGKKWGMISVNGNVMFAPKYDIIENIENLIKIGMNEKFDLVTGDFFIPYLDGNTNKLNLQYADLELLHNQMLLLYRNDQQAIFTTELQPLVPFQNHELIPLEVGILAETSDGFKIYLRKSIIQPSELWSDADYSADWLMLKKTTWNLYSSKLDTLFQSEIDSLQLLNANAIQTFKSDTSTIYFTNGKSFKKPMDCEMSIISSPPTRQTLPSFYYQFTSSDSPVVIINDALDSIKIPNKAKNIAALGREYIIYSYKDKKGLLDSLGNDLLPPDYDGIANYNRGSVTLLNDGELGLYNLMKNTLIPAEYHKSLKFYSDTVLIAFQDDKYGLITKSNQIILPMEYEKIEYFNDSVAWVSKGDEWNLMNIYSSNLIMDNITSFSQPAGFGPDSYYFETTRGRGVTNSQTGLLVNGSFTDIEKKGTQIDPIYITELFVNEAGLYVQVIYDKEGKIIFRNAYSEEEYEKVICDK